MKVAVLPEYVTAPGTGVAPGPVSVNVLVLIVAGFITELKVALTVVLRGTEIARFAGDMAITVGNAGLDVCSRPHPATRATNTNAIKNVFPILKLRISFSCSTGVTSFPFFDSMAALHSNL